MEVYKVKSYSLDCSAEGSYAARLIFSLARKVELFGVRFLTDIWLHFVLPTTVDDDSKNRLKFSRILKPFLSKTFYKEI